MNIFDVDNLLNKLIKEMRYAEMLIDNLHGLGYCLNFELEADRLVCRQTQTFFFPRDFQVDEVYRFDQDFKGIRGYYLYALRDLAGTVKGLFTAYPVPDLSYNQLKR
jgi:hypothetical protein